ncbi:hypothetical protein AADZ90_015385 [Aestuariibius sp. 2305UL40-4]|uniref:hypothetical protein n=1 Tax=Aestuariibius violaceus TaxID=3234132 RepID=UPI00345E1266
MSEPAFAAPEPAQENERIRLWREERARIADEGKKERLLQAAEDRARQQAEEAKRQRAEAEALLPDEADIARIAADLDRRRSLRKSRLLAQFATFIVLPVIAVVTYLSTIAVPLFEATAVVAITRDGQRAEQGALGAFGIGGRVAPAPELYMAHEFVRSGQMMAILDDKTGLVGTLSGPTVDPVFRLRDIPTLSIDRESGFRRFVDASIDVQSGLLTLSVQTPDPIQSTEIAQLALEETAQQINRLNTDIYTKRVASAEAAVDQARQSLASAHADLTKLQLETREADPRQRIGGVYSRIEALEAEADRVQADLTRAEIAGQSGTYRTEQLEQFQTRLQSQINAERQLLVGGPEASDTPLTAQLMQHERTALEVRIAEEALTEAQRALSAAREDAASNMSVFQIVVPPQSAATPTHPSIPAAAFLTLLLALCAFGAIKMLLPQRRF